MKRLYAVILLCLFGWNFQASDQKIAHGFISSWRQGSYGNYPGIARNKPPLPIYVWIQFDQPTTPDTVKIFFDFLIQSLKQIDRSLYYQPLSGHPGSYCIIVPASMTQDQLQEYIDKANKYIDPGFKSSQEIVQNKKASDQKIDHGVLSSWRQDSPALPNYIYIRFDQSTTPDTVKTFFDFLIKSLQPIDPKAFYQPLEGHPGFYQIVVQYLMPVKQLWVPMQEYIDKANKYIDPEEVAKVAKDKSMTERIEAIKKAEAERVAAEIQAAKDKVAKDKAEAERIKMEQRAAQVKAAEEAQKAAQAQAEAKRIAVEKQAEVDKQAALKKISESSSPTELNPIDTRNDFTILKLTPGQATMADVKKAYKDLSLIHYPDKNKDNKELAGENFKLIKDARDNIEKYYEDECRSNDAIFKAQSINKYKIS